MPGEDTAELGQVDDGGEAEPLLDLPVDDSADIAEAELDETTDPVSPFEGRPLEEVAQDPVVEKLLKDREAKLNESYRQRLENEEQRAQAYWEEKAYESRATEAEQVRKGIAFRGLASIVKVALDRGEQPPANVLVPLMDQLSNSAFHEQFDALTDFSRDELIKAIPDFRPSPDVVARLEYARRVNNPRALMLANMQMTYEAVRAEEWPHALKAAWDYVTEQNKVEGAKKAQGTRNGQARPSLVGSAAGKRDYDAVLSSNASTEEQRNAAFKAKYGFEL